MTYKIVRFHSGSYDRELIATGLTLSEAKAHCQRDDSHGDDWFDGYYREES
jgi:hypothetical protein